MPDDPSFPDDVVAAAMESQATLSEKITALRALTQPFPRATSPAAADRWVADGRRAAGRGSSGPPRGDSDR